MEREITNKSGSKINGSQKGVVPEMKMNQSRGSFADKKNSQNSS